MRRCSRDEWAKFRKYHYLSSSINNAAICYGVYDKDKIVAFIGVLHFPNAVNKKIKSISRLCVLPDYQGIGIGKSFLRIVAKKYAEDGFDVKITTSAKNLICALKNSPDWVLVRYGKTSKTKNGLEEFNASIRDNCKTATFFFKSKA